MGFKLKPLSPWALIRRRADVQNISALRIATAFACAKMERIVRSGLDPASKSELRLLTTRLPLKSSKAVTARLRLSASVPDYLAFIRHGAFTRSQCRHENSQRIYMHVNHVPIRCCLQVYIACRKSSLNPISLPPLVCAAQCTVGTRAEFDTCPQRRPILFVIVVYLNIVCQFHGTTAVGKDAIVKA